MSSTACTITRIARISRSKIHYTDTAGATDHVFGLSHLLDYRFAPRIKGLKDRKLYSIEKPSSYPSLEPLIGGLIDTAAIVNQATELKRLSASIKTGTVAPSVILRKLRRGRQQSIVPRLAGRGPD
jgi:TnpA family transposase